MTHIKWLHDRPYYEDRYDRITVERCLWTENFQPKRKKPLSDAEEKVEKEYRQSIIDFQLYHLKGNRYVKRTSTIDRWIEQDRKRDEKIENAQVPTKVICKFCIKPMEFIDSHLNIGFENDEEDCMEFWFICKGCDVSRTVFDNGRVEDRIPWKCPKCTRRLNTSSKRIKDKITTTDECPFCGYKKVDELDLARPKAKIEPTEEEEKEFRINKDRFCLSDKEGTEFIRSEENFKQLVVFLEGLKKEDAPKVKTLTLPQLEKALVDVIKKEGFAKFEFGKSNTSKGIVIEFSVQDTVDRVGYDSKKILKKIIKQAIEGTNWSLTASGIEYRLGILTGNLRGSEHAGDFYVNANGDRIKL